MTINNIDDFKLLPRVRSGHLNRGTLATTGEMRITLSKNCAALRDVFGRDAQTEWHCQPMFVIDETLHNSFAIGFAREPALTKHEVLPQPEAYKLIVSEQGVAACATDYNGLLYAWQTFKQLRRATPTTLPCLIIDDNPDLRWRIYHVDLKGTRRNLTALHAMLPRLAELKLNGVLVEYEDFLRYDAYPDLAIAEAPDKDEWRAWIAAAAQYGVSVIPLLQTLGHWQYILRHERYAHLAEDPTQLNEGCSTLPATWELAHTMLQEIIALHPTAPFIHVGLDETFNIGTCPRCLAKLAGHERHDLYVEWLNRICQVVSDHDLTPMAWADVVSTHLDDQQRARINKNITLTEWGGGYVYTGPLQTAVNYHGIYASKEWRRRPNSSGENLPAVSMNFKDIDEMPAEHLQRLKPLLDNPAYPEKFRICHGFGILEELGYRPMGVSGVRVSFHGNIMPRFIQGQLNSIACANALRETNGWGQIASSWSRGNSFASENAHPDLDWYGLASMADATWTPLPYSQLRQFDENFAWQFFGQPDGLIGDLFYAWERTAARVDHVMINNLGYIVSKLPALLEKTTRNREILQLFARLLAVQQLRFRGQFALLEIEYFYANWHNLPLVMKKRIDNDIGRVLADITTMLPQLVDLYGQTLCQADAAELAASQLCFIRDNVKEMRKKTQA